MQCCSLARVARAICCESGTSRVRPYGRCDCGRVAALGEALSVTFRVTLVQTVSRRPVTMPHDLSRPPHRQRRPDRSPRRPGRFSRPPLCALALLASAKAPNMARRSGPSTAVSCISRAFRAFKGHDRVLYHEQRPEGDRTRARASLQRRFRTGMHQSLLIYASREQHRVCSG